MGNIYVNSAATGANNGTTKTDAFTTLSAAVTAWTTADIILMADTHAESSASNITLASANDTETIPIPIYSIDFATDQYKPGTSAQVSTTGASSINININVNCEGVYFAANNVFAFNTGLDAKVIYKDCIFECPNTSGNRYIAIYDGTDRSSKFIFKNCTFNFNNGTQNFYIYSVGGDVRCIGCTFNVIANANGIFRSDTGGNCHFLYCDLTGSTFTTDALYASGSLGNIFLKLIACSLPASFPLSIFTGNKNQFLELLSCEAGGLLDRYAYVDGDGNLVDTSTTVYRDAGVQGLAGPFSYQLTPASTLDRIRPIATPNIRGYVALTGSRTFTVELAHNFTSLTTTKVWFELSYLGTASESNRSLETSLPHAATGIFNPIDAGSALTSSSETWTGAAGLTKAKLSKTVTINRAGIYGVKVYLGYYEAGKVLHVDGKVSVA